MAVLQTSACSPDGKLVAGGRAIGNVVFVYELPSGRLKKTLAGELNDISIATTSLSFSADSVFLAAAGIDNMVVVWDMRTDKIVLRLPDMKGALALAFSPTLGALAVSGPGNGVTLVSVPEGRQIGQLSGHSAPVLAMAFSPDGNLLATGSSDKTTRIWNIADRQPLRTLEGNAYPVHSVSFSPDGSMLATYAGEIKLWGDRGDGGRRLALPEPKISPAEAAGVIVMSIPMPLLLVLLDPDSPVANARAVASKRLPLAFSPNGIVLAVVRYKERLNAYEIVLHDFASNTTKTIACQCMALSFNPDGTILAAVGSFGAIGLGAPLRLLDPSTGTWLDTQAKK